MLGFRLQAMRALCLWFCSRNSRKKSVFVTRGVVRCSGTHAYYTVGVVSGLLVVAVRGSSLSLWVAEGRGMINHVRL